MTLVRTLALFTVAAVSLGACASTDKQGSMAPAATATSYPLTTCLVTDEPLGDRPTVIDYHGREVRFCCGGCIDTFKKSPEKYLAKLDAAKK